jgi:hypothetical protein
MTQEDREDIKRYIGIVAEDFQHKLEVVIEGQQVLERQLTAKIDEFHKDLLAEIRLTQLALRSVRDDLKADIGENRAAIEGNRIAIGENREAIEGNRIAIGENRAAIADNRAAIEGNRIAIGENREAIRHLQNGASA